MMSSSDLAGSTGFACVRWTTPLTSSVLLQGAAPFQGASPESTAKSGGWGEGAAQPALSLQDPKHGSVLGHSNGNRWNMYLHVFTCVQRKIWTAWETHSQSDMRIIQRELQQKDSWQLGISAQKEFGWRSWKRGNQTERCLRHCLPGWQGASDLYLSLIYWRRNEKCFDILHLLLCHIGYKIVKGLPGFLWQASYLWRLIFLPIQLQMA